MRKLLVGASLVMSMLSASAALAGDVDDVVRLKDGGLLRGVIIELVANDHVLIRLPTGEDRRIEMSEVEFAGPRGEDPHAGAVTSPPAGGAEPGGTEPSDDGAGSVPSEPRDAAEARPAPAEQAPEAGAEAAQEPGRQDKISFVSNQVGVTFHLRDASASKGGPATHPTDSVSRLCTAPCKADLPPGPHRFALSIRGREPVVASEITTTGEPMTIEGKYDDYATVRIAGWSLIVGGGVIALSSLFFAHTDCQPNDGPDCKTFDPAVILGMSGAGIAAAVGGFFMVRVDDDASVRISPGVASMGAPRFDAGRGAF